VIVIRFVGWVTGLPSVPINHGRKLHEHSAHITVDASFALRIAQVYRSCCRRPLPYGHVCRYNVEHDLLLNSSTSQSSNTLHYLQFRLA
jgi:hypothetical protein